MTPRELKRLAARHGVQSAYRTNDGRRASASPESLLAILQALGAVDEAGRTLDRDDTRASDALQVEPVQVAWEGERPAITVLAQGAPLDSRVELALTFESGEQREWQAELGAGIATHDGEDGIAYRLQLPGLPRGYHQLSLGHAGRAYETMIITAPRRCYGGEPFPRWGLFAPAYGLHDRETLGVGTVREMRAFARWIGERGGALLGTLPLLAADMELDPSPYRPLSRLFWNEQYADISGLAIREPLRAELRELARMPIVDQARVSCVKHAAIAEHLATRRIELPSDDERLLDYARFRACAERHGSAWREWPAQLREGTIEPGEVDTEAVRRHAFAQQLVTDQLENVTDEMRDDGVELYLDVPLGVHPDGYDRWRFRRLFLDGCSTGAPPDAFFSLGQNWAFPPQHPEELRRSGYSYTIAALRHHMRRAGLVRIDHVMGLHRLYVIPEGVEARDGAYLQYRADEMYAILAVESHRNRCAVVGENLGTVPGYINRSLAGHGLHGMYVAEFETSTEQDGRLPVPTPDTIASIDTHDTATFAAFWEGKDIDERLARGLLHEEDEAAEREGRARMRERVMRAFDIECANASTHAVLSAWLRFIAESPASYVIANTEDLWLETEPQNRPGTSEEYPNWRRRFAKSIEEMREDAPLVRMLDELASAHGAVDHGAERRRAG